MQPCRHLHFDLAVSPIDRKMQQNGRPDVIRPGKYFTRFSADNAWRLDAGKVLVLKLTYNARMYRFAIAILRDER